MKKRFLPVFLALALSLGLCAVPAFAADEVTTIEDEAGFAYTLSKPLVGKYVAETGMHYLDEGETVLATNVPVYQIVEGTAIAPKNPQGTPEMPVYETSGSGIVYHISDEAGREESGSATGSNFTVNHFILEGMSPEDTGDKWYLACIAGLESGMYADRTPSQPMAPGLYIIDRELNWQEPPAGGSEDPEYCYSGSYLYVEVLTAEKAAELTGQELEPAPSFTDVPSWCADAVNWAVARGVTNGTGTGKFSPSNQCSNAQIITFLWRAAGEPSSSAALPIDITGKNVAYAETALRWAAGKGMIDGTLNPNASCTRASAVTYIWKSFRPVEGWATDFFTDVEVSAPYADAVCWAVDNGITNGYDNGDETFSFRPDKVCSRGEIVTMLHRFYAADARQH